MLRKYKKQIPELLHVLIRSSLSTTRCHLSKAVLLPFAEYPLGSSFTLGKMQPRSSGDDCTISFIWRNKPAPC